MAEEKQKKSFVLKTRKPSDLTWEQNTLRQIFPAEIWLLIFDRHSSSVDLHSACQASKYFKDFLFPDRVQWLFPFVCQLIATKVIRKTTVLSPKYLFSKWLQTLLTLRLVCVTWSKAIDQTFERIDAYDFIEAGLAWEAHYERVESDFHIRLNGGYPKDKAKLLKFLPHFEQTHLSAGARCPLVSRTVSIYSFSQEMASADSSWPVCLKILSIYGKYVKHCTIVLDDCYQLPHLLTLMPNLQALCIFYSKYKFFERIQPKPQEMPSTFLDSLPKLPNLRFLDDVDVPHSLTQAMISKCSNLSGFVRRHERGFDVSGLTAHPLKQLRICVDLQAYTSLKGQGYSWPLTDLELDFGKNCFVEWPELFALLHRNWNTTLKRFKTVLPGTTQSCYLKQIADWSFTPMLQLDRLTHLTLVLNNLHSLDFIMPLVGTLECLSVGLEYSMNEIQTIYKDPFRNIKQKQIIKLLGHVEEYRMIRSNIWTLFPKLKQVKYKEIGNNARFRRPTDDRNGDFCIDAGLGLEVEGQ